MRELGGLVVLVVAGPRSLTCHDIGGQVMVDSKEEDVGTSARFHYILM